MREHLMLIVQHDAKHGARQHRRDGAFHFYWLLVAHSLPGAITPHRRRLVVSRKQKNEAERLRPASEVAWRLIALLAWTPVAAVTAVATASAAETTAATATASIAATATTTAGALFARAGFGDCDVAAIDILAVERTDGGLRFLGLGHGDECETARTSRDAIRDEVHVLDDAVRREEVLQTQFRGIEGKVSNE
jgi:hypothetical protein